MGQTWSEKEKTCHNCAHDCMIYKYQPWHCGAWKAQSPVKNMEQRIKQRMDKLLAEIYAKEGSKNG